MDKQNVSSQRAAWQQRVNNPYPQVLPPRKPTDLNQFRTADSSGSWDDFNTMAEADDKNLHPYERSFKGRRALWKQMEKDPESIKQSCKRHPGLSTFGAADASAEYAGLSHQITLGKHDASYGRPPPGSKTELRGIKAGQHISGEVVELCKTICLVGQKFPNGNRIVTFGRLFETYTTISNKVVGILLRARRHGLVEFEGEMLYQGRDNHVLISLVKIPEPLKPWVAEREGSYGQGLLLPESAMPGPSVPPGAGQ